MPNPTTSSTPSMLAPAASLPSPFPCTTSGYDTTDINNNNNNNHCSYYYSYSNVPSLTCALLGSLAAGGNTYAFGLYGLDLKHNLHLTQGQLDTISTAFFAAGLCSAIPGKCVDIWGPRKALLTSGMANAVSLITLWIVAQDSDDETTWVVVPPPLRVPVVSLLQVLTFLSNALAIGAIFKILVTASGPGSTGSAVGVAKGFLGLGAGTYATLFGLLRSPDQSNLDFLLLAAVLAVVVFTIPAFLLMPDPTKTPTREEIESPPAKQLDDSNHRQRDELRDRFMMIMTNPKITTTTTNTTTTISTPGSYAHAAPTASLPPASTLSSSSSHTKNQIHYRDDTTPQHFRIVYISFSVMVLLIVNHVHKQLVPSTTQAPAGRNIPMALILLLVWIVPILCLLRVPKRSQTAAAANADADADTAVSETTRTWTADTTRTLTDTTRTTTRDLSIVGDTPHQQYQQIDEEDDDDDDEEENGNYRFLGERSPLMMMTQNRNNRDYVDSLRKPSADHRTTLTAQPEAQAQAQLEQYTLSQMLRTPTAHLLLWTTTILVGAGIVITSHLGQMVESLGFEDPQDMTSACLAVFSVAQAMGRVLTGTLSEAAARTKQSCCCCCGGWLSCCCHGSSRGGDSAMRGIPRPTFLLIASKIAVVAHVTLAHAAHTYNPSYFVLGIALAGVSFGMVWPLMVLIVGEVFGHDHVGANYMFIDGMACAAGTLLVSKGVAQHVYEHHMTTTTTTTSSSTRDDPTTTKAAASCLGSDCFGPTHVWIAALAWTSVVSSIGILITTRSIYQRLHRRNQSGNHSDDNATRRRPRRRFKKQPSDWQEETDSVRPKGGMLLSV